MVNIIKVKDLTKVYKDGGSNVTALDKVSFNLKKGESAAIVGPSGSGKTTMLEIIGGLNKQSSGTIQIDNKDLSSLKDSELSAFRNKTMGFVFQLFHLQDYFNAKENVMLPMLINNMDKSEAEKHAVELLERVGLKKRVNHYPSQLSGGEMQRVSIARALANNPRIVMADEPTGKLDKKNAENVMEIFDEIAQSGTSVVVITHDMDIASRFSNIMTLEHGKIKI